MVETLYSKMAPWITAGGTESAIAVFCQASLMRNLADFPFPDKCRNEERQIIEERLVQAFDMTPLVAGRYCALAELDAREAFFLAERRLFSFDLFTGRSHGGVYVADDQSLSAGINGLNHVCMTVSGAGLQFQELWRRLDLLDNVLAEACDFAFDKHLGYLTSLFSHLGTGLKVNVVLHLPGLAMTNQLTGIAQAERNRRQALYGLKPVVISSNASPDASTGTEPAHETFFGEALYYDLTEAMYCDTTEAVGDLYLLTNQSTLGLSEEEILFHARRAAQDLIAEEKRARADLLGKERRRLEDRVARALGVARSARLMGFAEGITLLSSIRLGIDTGLISGYSLPRLNEMLFASQSAHLKVKAGRDCDEWTLSMERADLFRQRFSQDRKGF